MNRREEVLCNYSGAGNGYFCINASSCGPKVKRGFVNELVRFRECLKKFIRGKNHEVAAASLFTLRETSAYGRMGAELLGMGIKAALGRFGAGERREAAKEVARNIRNAE
jgi:hypothetical protein